MTPRSRIVALGALFIVVCSGCASNSREWKPIPTQITYEVAHRQLPPEPVYNRLRWVRPPEVLPARLPKSGEAPLIKPVIEFQVRNTPLEEVAQVLAASARYGSYCASSVATQRLTLQRLGTIDEIARAIEQEAKVAVVVDHERRMVRILRSRYVSPRFFDAADAQSAEGEVHRYGDQSPN